MADPTIALTPQLMEWIIDRLRTYAEVLEAWRVTYPRLSIWEDACAEELIKYNAAGDRVVSLSPKGHALLQCSLESTSLR